MLKINGTTEELAIVKEALYQRTIDQIDVIRAARAAGDHDARKAAIAARSKTYEVLDRVEQALGYHREGGGRCAVVCNWMDDGIALEPNAKGAESRMFASFNDNPTLCVSIPNGSFTISARTTDGRRITFAFQPYETGGAPQCCDIQYHDSGRTQQNGKLDLSSFHVLGFKPGASAIAFDTRKETAEPTLIAVLMDEQFRAAEAAKQAAQAQGAAA